MANAAVEWARIRLDIIALVIDVLPENSTPADILSAAKALERYLASEPLQGE